MSAGAKWAIGCGAALALALVALFVIMIGAMVGVIGGMGEYGALPGANVALIRIEGPITAGASFGGPFAAGAASEGIIKQLRQAADDDSIEAVLVRINSPGGSAAGSQEIYQEIRRLRDEGKPVFASMGDVAASGGYYVAAAAERIYANPGTITGSIGVIAANLDLSGLFDKIGIEPEVVKEGEFKDMGSGLRPMNEAERRIIQQLLNDIYRQFVADVAEGRKMPEERVKELADGRIHTGKRALELKLVDELGSIRTALGAVAKRAGIRDEPKVVEYGKRSLMEALFGEIKAPPPSMMRGLLYDRTADLITRGALRVED